MSSGNRWIIKCQGWLFHTPSRPVPSSLVEGQHDFSYLPGNTVTRNTSNENTKESGNFCHVQHLGRNKNICSQHESYQLHHLAFNGKKNTIMIHECNWWQGSNSYSAAGGMLRSRPGHWGGTPTCQGTRNTSATAAPLPGVSNTSFQRQRPPGDWKF